MNRGTQNRIRALLLSRPAGMTLVEIGQTLDLCPTNVAKRIKETYGCYVDRWVGMRQVWACMPVPAHAEAPYMHPKIKTKQKYLTHARVIKPKPEKKVRTKKEKVVRVKPVIETYKPEKTFWQEVKPW